MEIKFPKDFLWGTSTSAHQVEGNNRNNQWWQWEWQREDLTKSGIACDHYNRWKEDFNLMTELGYKAHRFSIEWSRIEPKKQQFNKEAIEHYKQIIEHLKRKNIKPIVMLHHYTNPIWFMDEGGWVKKKNIEYFVQFVDCVTKEFDVDYWLTIDEPMVYAFHSYLTDEWPPVGKDIKKAFKVASHMLQAHAQSYTVIHANRPGSKVSFSKVVDIFDPVSDSSLDRWSAQVQDYLFNEALLDSLYEGTPKPPLSGEQFGNTLDFIGLNYFTRQMCYFDSDSPSPPLYYFKSKTKNNCEINFMGWEVYPEGIYRALMRLKKFNKPILITSNGIGTNDDLQRRIFIINHLKWIHKAMQQGIKVIGYMYWSFLDNFEWDKGFAPRFGLVEVNYHTLERRPRDSAHMYSDIIAYNGVNTKIKQKYLP